MNHHAAPRQIGVSLALVVATLAAGLLLRFAPIGLPPGTVKYGGSTMWALLIYWIASTVFSLWRPAFVAVLAGGLATAVEVLKLYRSPGLDAFRLTLPGVLLLGRYFSTYDIVAYWLAILAGAWLDASLLRQRQSALPSGS